MTSSERPLGFSAAVRQLSTAQKSGAGAPPYSRWVNRRVGRVLAALAYVAGLTPNQVTVLSACCTFSALTMVALISPQWWLGLLVSGLLLLGYALDSADGQLARLLGAGSKRGEWLDHTVDATKVSVLHSTVLISFYRFTDASDVQLLVVLGYQVIDSIFFFGLILIDQLRRKAGAPTSMAPTRSRRSELMQSALAFPTDYAVLCLCFALLGWQSLFRPVYTAMFLINLAVLPIAVVRWWRQVGRLDAVPA